MGFWNWKKADAPAARIEPAITAEITTPSNQGMSLADARQGSELYTALTGGQSASGMAVNEQTAMRVSAVYACVSLIGGALASMPVHVYRRENQERERVDHALWWLLNEQPWATISAAVFWEYAAWSVLLHGDSFSRIHRVNPLSPEIKGLEPLHPLTVDPRMVAGRLVYLVYGEGGKVDAVDQDDMLHVPGVGFDGRRGMSALRYALRNPAGIALAADEYSGGYFRNGAKADHAIIVQGKTDKEQVALMQSSWRENRSLSNSFVPVVLSGGAKLESLSISAEDAQLIETRRMQVEEIARIFGVPPFMIGHTTNTTSWGSGVEQMGIGFVKYTLQRHLVKFEQEINRKCFRTAQYFAEFNTAGLERGDMKSRYEAYRIALGRAGERAWIDPETICRIENLPKPSAASQADGAPDTTGENDAAA